MSPLQLINEQPFELLLNADYRIIKPCNGLMTDEVIKYIGTSLSPADRGHDLSHMFQQASGRIIHVADQHVPSTVGESFSVFEDVLGTINQLPEPARSIVKELNHRSHIAREYAAEGISLALPDFQLVIPHLVTLALHSSKIRNVFAEALCRLNPSALNFLEGSLDATEHGNYEKLLAKLGSKKFIDKYIDELKSNKIQVVRNAIGCLSDIADSQSINALETLIEHSNYNIRTDALHALEKIRSGPS